MKAIPMWYADHIVNISNFGIWNNSIFEKISRTLNLKTKSPIINFIKSYDQNVPKKNIPRHTHTKVIKYTKSIKTQNDHSSSD